MLISDSKYQQSTDIAGQTVCLKGSGSKLDDMVPPKKLHSTNEGRGMTVVSTSSRRSLLVTCCGPFCPAVVVLLSLLVFSCGRCFTVASYRWHCSEVFFDIVIAGASISLRSLLLSILDYAGL